MKPIKVIVFSSKPYSPFVLKALKQAKNIKIIKVVEDRKQLEGLNSKETKVDVGIVAAFGVILKPNLLKLPLKGILNIHPSLLPQYRGSSPIQTAILSGDNETGVTIIKMDEQIDHGLIVKQTKAKISKDDTNQTLYQKLFTKGAKMIIELLPDYLEGKIKPEPQKHQEATYTQKLTKDSGQIDWQKDNQYNERFLRAMSPWPGAWTNIKIKNENKRLKILKSHLEGKNLIIDQVQLEGKKQVSFKQFKEGYPEVSLKN